MGFSPPKSFGVGESLILHNYSSSNQIGTGASSQVKAGAEILGNTALSR